MDKRLTHTFGGAAVTAAGLSTFAMVAGVGGNEYDDLLAGDILADMAQAPIIDVVHEPIQNPLLDNLYIDFNTDVADIFSAAGQSTPDSASLDTLIQDAIAGPDLTNGNFLTFTNMPQSEISYEAAADYNKHFLQNGAGVFQEVDYVTADLVPALIAANEYRAQNFLYISDQEQYRTLDKWTEGEIVDDVNPMRRDIRSGDCDEYSLWGARDNNQKFGVSGSAQTFVILDPKDPDVTSLHAMLLVRTTEGDRLFDMDGSARFPQEVAKDYDFMYAMSFTDKTYWQKVSPTPFGVEATVDATPEYAEGIELPRPRPDHGPKMPKVF